MRNKVVIICIIKFDSPFSIIVPNFFYMKAPPLPHVLIDILNFF